MSHLARINLKQKKKQLLSMSITLPMLIFGVSQSVTTSELINRDDFLLSKPSITRTVSNSQAKLNSNTSEPLYLAARGNTTKKCNWLGICDQEQ
ncbi:MAG: hypothetical protein F6K14_16910 [Symploca sp. SIO2C1]|nr:hypothetical protein [Symploca sp. SIO2C1]